MPVSHETINMKVIWQNVSTEGQKLLPKKDLTWLSGLNGEKPSRAKGTENCEGDRALRMATNFVCLEWMPILQCPSEAQLTITFQNNVMEFHELENVSSPHTNSYQTKATQLSL